MVNTLKLPVGIDSFEKIRKIQFYYIDKTKLIEQLVETGGEVTLFTRPRLIATAKRLLYQETADKTTRSGYQYLHILHFSFI